MTDDGVLTGRMLLTHIQGVKSDLQTQINALAKTMDRGFAEMRQGFAEMTREMRQGFKETNEHITALQEDLYETMRVQRRHGKKLARL